MKIEVAIEGREPYSHPLNKEKTVIGSGDESDLVLKIKGISRKHVIVIMEEDRFYVTDQGSAGGTFINEEQLVPGQRAEFTSFFPIRLGEYVTLSLLSDEEETRTFEFAKALAAEAKKEESRSTVINPTVTTTTASPRRVITSPSSSAGKKGIEGREGVHSRKKAKPVSNKVEASSDSRLMGRTVMLAAFVAVGGAGLFFYFRHTPENTVEVVRPVATEQAEAPEPDLLLSELVLAETAPPIVALSQVTGKLYCSGEGDFQICKDLGLPFAQIGKTGLSVTPDTVVIAVPTMKRDDLWGAIQSRILLAPTAKELWPEQLEARDVAAIYLYGLGKTFWEGRGDYPQWLYLIELSTEGEELRVLYASLVSFKKAVLAKIIDPSAAFSTGSMDELAQLSGLFRALD